MGEAAVAKTPDGVAHVVFYSGGKASFLCAHRVIERYGKAGVTLLFTDTLIEDADTYRFLDVSAEALGVPVTRLADGRTMWEIFAEERMLANDRVPLCSRILKQKVARPWVKRHCDPASTTLHFGIDWTEEHRMDRIRKRWTPYTCDSALLWAPLVEKAAADAVLASLGIRQPHLYDLGASHNNCGGLCCRAGHGTFAWALRAIPEVYAEWEQHEAALRSQLGDVAILRQRRGNSRERRGRSWKPLPLSMFRARVEKTPQQIDMFDIGGCNCFV